MISQAQPTDYLPKSVLEASLNGIFVVEIVENSLYDVVDYRFVFANKAARAQTFLLKNARVGATFHDLLPEADFKNLSLLCHTVRITGHDYQGERYYSAMNEWFRMHITRLSNTHLAITLDNISRLKQVAFQSQPDLELFQSVLATVADPIVVGRPLFDDPTNLVDFEVILVSPAAQEAWFFESPLRVGATLTQLLPLPERTALLSRCRQVYQTGHPQRFGYHYTVPNRWYSVVLNRFNQGVILNATDMTNQRTR